MSEHAPVACLACGDSGIILSGFGKNNEMACPYCNPTGERRVEMSGLQGGDARKPRWEPVPEVPTTQVQWMGDPIESMPAAEAILRECTDGFSADDVAKALKFYGGDQWPEGPKIQRKVLGRPFVTVNRLPLLVAASLEASWRAGSNYFTRVPSRSLSEEQEKSLARLKVIITRRNWDAQEMYNYLCSNLVERMRVEYVTGTAKAAV